MGYRSAPAFTRPRRKGKQMTMLTDDGRRILNDIAGRYGLSSGAVEEMARAVARGGGTMAQFNIPELGGSGQWMLGGMTMVGDMFNNSLKAQVESLCGEINSAMANATLFNAPQTLSGSAWWPAELGQPSSSGGQNTCRYAYFPAARRIAVDPGNGAPVILLDTLDHQIGGFGQQQSAIGDPFAGVSFSSQFGQFALSSLPPAMRNDQPMMAATPPKPQPSQTAEPVGLDFTSPAPPAAPVAPTQVSPAPAAAVSQPEAPAMPAAPSGDANDVIGIIERLAALHAAGVLSAEEFGQKKAELLARL